MINPSTALAILCFYGFITGSYSTYLTIVNNCKYTVWPAILSSTGRTLPLSTTGFTLQAGEYSTMVKVQPSWRGRVVGRTLCSFDSSGAFSCLTGDCGFSTVQCPGENNTALPATSAEFNLNGGAGGMDLYGVTLAYGYNIPLVVEPQGGTGAGKCTATGCVRDLIYQCPSELMMISDGKPVGCKSSCQAFRDDQSCCTGAYEDPQICRPSAYAPFFKKSCPQANVFLYDQSMTFACSSSNYLITFCPSSSTRNGKNHPAKKADAGDVLDRLPNLNNGKTKKGIKKVINKIVKYRVHLSVGTTATAIIGLITYICKKRKGKETE